ncbi:dTDP-4-dehydrorhamnose reductase [Winogradskyella aurantia]|uniref:dTDP-4-dehydrorhamnose reductase n=1 Tax=Winogradskyella aurantia TaxID=1915063 RepID=A0A265UZV3_9FLAO|nr:dTDP-4-dehydrorhamnose reductase [Winogradskyella aurantia]OZV70826.1 dTDP-4-dehydrorhamnose reductase [Winogradskyella aurantia]
MKQVLVTGAKGQLGRCLQSISDAFNDFEFHFTDIAELNITDSQTVSDYFKTHKFDWCINCAAYTAVDKAETEVDKAKSINVEGVRHLAKASEEAGAKLLHISTDFVFDGKQNIAYTEKIKANPLSVYGKTKLDGENVIKDFLSRYFIVRTSWLYSEYANNFMKTMLRLSEDRNELRVVVDQIGTPTYAKDLAYFILELITKDSEDYGIYHFSNLGVASWYDFAKAIFEIKAIDVTVNAIKSESFPTPAQRPVFSVLDTTKTKETFDYKIPFWRDSLKLALMNLK